MHTHSLVLTHSLTRVATGRSTARIKSVELEDIKFHQCVRLARFENDRTISFIPPDGTSLTHSRMLTHSLIRTHPLTNTYSLTHLLTNSLTHLLTH